ncbi:MAG: acetyl-CoA carboxylase biotin carboxyl carrier protein [Pyrinomonadaceae bacterium]
MNDQNRPEPTGAAPARDTQRDSREPQPRENAGVQPDTRGGAADFGGRRNPRRRHGGREDQPRQQQSPSRSRTEQSINMDELRELFGLISAQGFTEFELEKEGFRVRMRRDVLGSAAQHNSPSASQPVQSIPFAPTQNPPPVTPQPTPPPATKDAGGAAAEKVEESADADLFMLTSPIVGTFYRSPSPTADAFVRAGSHVEPDTVVCIVEAMKLMNEIQAETTGTIEKIYVENGQAVEYGQPLFGIRK